LWERIVGGLTANRLVANIWTISDAILRCQEPLAPPWALAKAPRLPSLAAAHLLNYYELLMIRPSALEPEISMPCHASGAAVWRSHGVSTRPRCNAWRRFVCVALCATVIVLPSSVRAAPETAPQAATPSNNEAPTPREPDQGADPSLDRNAPRPMAAVSTKLLRYAERIIQHYDKNGDGKLEAIEWQAMHGQPELADADHDGRITAREFAQYAANYGAGRAIRLSSSGGTLADTSGQTPGELGADGTPMPRGGVPGQVNTPDGPARDPRRDLKFFAALPDGIPQWFVDRDTDGDGQLTLSEYSPKLLKAELDEFNRYDLNRDGVLTVPEFLRGGKATKSEPRN